ncbi:MAG: TadE/TadG family type IV pilus assembly protein [Phyllobacterium sp.]
MSSTTINNRPSSGSGSLLIRFFANRRGTVAIEFAMIALPFFFMIFATLEVSLSFTAQQVMANVTDDIARQLRTGQLRAADVSGQKLKQRICARLLMPESGCPNLVVDLRSYASFASVPLAVPLTAGGDVNATGFRNSPGGTGTINQLRIFYRWPIVSDFMRYRLDGIDGTGRTLLFSSATWRNEPYL